jgi:hypothetical protein
LTQVKNEKAADIAFLTIDAATALLAKANEPSYSEKIPARPNRVVLEAKQVQRLSCARAKGERPCELGHGIMPARFAFSA